MRKFDQNLWIANSDHLHDHTPAVDWADAYPLGDGRIGAMVWGKPCGEIISLNHDLLWRNYLKQPTCGTAEDMPELKKLCMEQRWEEAEEILEQTLPNMKAIYINPFVPALDQYITMFFMPEESVTDYTRWLDLKNGTAHTQFTVDGVVYHRTHFCSAVSGLFVTHITSSLPAMLTGKLSLSRMPDPECSVTGGAGRDHVFCEAEFEEGVTFAGVSKIIHRNGRLTSGKPCYGMENDGMAEKKFGNTNTFDRNDFLSDERGASVCFDHCDELWIYTAISVDAETDHPLQKCYELLENVLPYQELYEKHCKRFSEYYDRTKIRFDACEDDFRLPTSQLILRDREAQKPSPALCELACNMSRYTAISAGMPRPDPDAIKAPINLQGIWNRDTHPVWESDYHLDLNLEMCYWSLPLMGLTEFMEPLLDWMERLLPQARNLAKDLYGSPGAIYSGCCDYKTIGSVDVVLSTSFGISSWLIQLLWIYYEHDPRPETLTRIYAIMREIDVFYRDSMYETENGTLTFPFGASPEMSWRNSKGRQFLSSPSTFDLTLVREFYGYLKTAARMLGDDEYADTVSSIVDRIAEPSILDDGTLCEWTYPHDEFDIGHRHRSPFAAFCPGSLYSVESDPDMVIAMEKLLEKRLSVGNRNATAFTYPLDAHLMVRMRRGEDAYDKLTLFLCYYALDNLMFAYDDWAYRCGGANWFSGVKLIQAEAQLGMYSAFSEMLYQDTQGIIRLLPALPAALATGSAAGIRGRNGNICNLEWKDGENLKFSIYTPHDGMCSIMPPDHNFSLLDENGEIVQGTWDKNIFTFESCSGMNYTYIKE